MPMVFRPLLRLSVVRPVHEPKADDPMVVTLPGMVSVVSSLHFRFVAHIDNQRVVCNTVEKSY